MSARLAYAPTLALSPQGTVSSWDKGKATQTYSLPVTASWQIDLFGQILNPKRGAQVSLKQTQFYEQAVQTQVIANVANMYYTLLMLDRQLQITESTADILKKNVETVEAMKDAGIYNTTSAGVEQTRAAYAQVLASLPGMRQSIRETENALCLMLNQPAQEIERGVLENQQLPTEFSAGIPLQLLSNRPDVKAIIHNSCAWFLCILKHPFHTIGKCHIHKPSDLDSTQFKKQCRICVKPCPHTVKCCCHMFAHQCPVRTAALKTDLTWLWKKPILSLKQFFHIIREIRPAARYGT